MKTARFFWFYLKRYKLSFAVIFLMIIIATYMQVKAPVYLGQALTELGTWVQEYFKTKAIAEASGKDFVKPTMDAFQAVMGRLLMAYLSQTSATLIFSFLFTRIIGHSTNRMRKGLFGKFLIIRPFTWLATASPCK